MRLFLSLSLGLLSSLAPVVHPSTITLLNGAVQAQSEAATRRIAEAAEITDHPELVEKIWRSHLAENPNSETAHISLGYALAEQGEIAAASEAFRAALEIDESNLPAQIGLGMMLQKRGSFEKAEALFVSAIKANNKSPFGYLHLGRLLKDKGELEAARENFQTVIEIAPIGYVGGIAFHEIGKIYAAQNNLAKAARAHWRAVGLDPHNLEYWQDLLDVVKAQGNTAALTKIAGEIRFLKAYEAERADKKDFALKQHFNPDNYETQIADAQALLERYPENVSFWQELGTALHRLGEFEEAEKSFRRAIALSPNNARAYYNLSEVLADLGQDNSDTLQTAQQISPKLPLPTRQIDSLSGMSIDEYTNEVFRNRPLELNYPNDAPFPPTPRPFPSTINPTPRALPSSVPVRIRPLPSLSELAPPPYRQSADYLERNYSITDLQAQIQFDPDSGLLRGILGQQMYEENKFTEAAVQFSQMALLDPRSEVIARNDTGVALYQLGNFESARGNFEQAISATKEDSNNALSSDATSNRLEIERSILYINLGFLLNRMGDWQGAADLYREAIALEIGGNAKQEIWQSSLASALKHLARTNYAEQQWAIAEEHYRESIRTYLDSASEVANELAATLLNQGKVQEAERFLTDLIANDPSLERYLYPGLATALERQGRTQEAETLIAKFRPNPSPSISTGSGILVPPPRRQIQRQTLPSPATPRLRVFSSPRAPIDFSRTTIQTPNALPVIDSSRIVSPSLFPSQAKQSSRRPSDQAYIANAYNALARERLMQGRYDNAIAIFNKPVYSHEWREFRDLLSVSLLFALQGNSLENTVTSQANSVFAPSRCYVDLPAQQDWLPENYIQEGLTCLDLLTQGDYN